MVGAHFASYDPTNGHQDQSHDDIHCDFVGAILETSLVEARGEILSQIATNIARVGVATIEQTQDDPPPGRVFRRATKDTKGGVSKTSRWILRP